MATWTAALTRAGPGLLLRDILKGDAQVTAAVTVIASAAPDVLLLTGFDHDLDGVALAALAERLGAAGLAYPHRFAPPGNRGMPSGADLDRNGRIGGPGDAQGWGRFAGAGGMAVLSRWPIGPGVRDFGGFLWRDLPGAEDPGAVLDAGALAVQRLHASGAWEVPVMLPGGAALRILAFHATPPVFDGPEDRNGRRNRDEAAFWLRLIGGDLAVPPPEPPFVLMGNANLDPEDGEGRRDALRALLAHPGLTDPAPASAGGAAAAAQGGANRLHRGDPARDTADFRDDPGPGNLRVDYVLPSAGLAVAGSGVIWPLPDDPFAEAVAAASRHRLVWVDIVVPEGAP
ncbi:MAG: endonuclease/exonuclease/phosphatase family protein [Gemmobacter sp.]